jgi:diguanylate cyclase (GGDEF)-like protein/PAS domain S-box-containing protein
MSWGRPVEIVLKTLFEDHDLRLVLVAALVCALSTFAGMTLLNHARRSEQLARRVWLGVAAVSVGFGIWTTHFVAMLAYDPGIALGYDMGVTLLSLAVAIALVGSGLWYAAYGVRRSDMVLAGTIVGLGIGAMHYVGMAAVIVGGSVAWNAPIVAWSALVGAVLGGFSMLLGTASDTWGARIRGALVLTLGIVSMHFTGMGAVGLENCYPIVSEGLPVGIVLAVATGSVVILLFALGGLYLDLRERRRAELEADRMRGLANAAVEGLLVSRNNIIVTANASFLRLVALSEEKVTGQHLARFIPPQSLDSLARNPSIVVEAELVAGTGERLPIEVIQRDVDFGGSPHQAFAIRDLSARKSAEQHIRYLAHHDPLTGLPNRASFSRALEEEIAIAARGKKSFAVLCLDLDRFKEVNDLFGHPAGDALLQRVAAALLKALAGRGRAARLGGDEFAVLLTDAPTPDRAGRIAEDILDSFRAANEGASAGGLISASMGIAFYPANSEDAEHLMSYADTALYRAKQDGRGVYRFYSNEMGAAVRDRRLLEHDLRHAVSRNELGLVYQPQIDIESGSVTGFEALIRWDHPERGRIAPEAFIPVAEECGLILQLGEWVLRSACAEAATWQAPLTVAVNVSAVQVHAPNFAQVVHEVLVQTGLAPGRLEIEITESALIRDMMRAVTTLRQIKTLGVRIAMDDFGTGYSSLANLRAFPFSKIKVDQSFIRSVDSNSQSAAIVRAVLGLGSGLNVPVIAEGVERQEELEFLRQEVCWGAQGYLISRPAKIDEFRAVTSGAETRIDARPPELLKAG